MSELPEVREYREAQLRRNQNWNEDAYVKMRLADAAIAALEAEEAECQGHYKMLSGQIESTVQRADAAEAALERARTYRGTEGWPCPLCEYKAGVFIKRCEMHRKLDEAEAEVERLKSVIHAKAEWHIRLTDEEWMLVYGTAREEAGDE